MVQPWIFPFLLETEKCFVITWLYSTVLNNYGQITLSWYLLLTQVSFNVLHIEGHAQHVNWSTTAAETIVPLHYVVIHFYWHRQTIIAKQTEGYKPQLATCSLRHVDVGTANWHQTVLLKFRFLFCFSLCTCSNLLIN